MTYEILTPAKINLHLDVLSKRDDGYHDLISVMQSISLYDKISLEIEKSENINIFICSNDKTIEWNEKNLVYRACEAFLKKSGIKNGIFKFKVEKNIPIGAGMAGGSTDAAGALKLLNIAFSNAFSLEELCSIGKPLGADIPFCLYGGTCVCRGIGESITPIKSFVGKSIVCAIDSSSVSTPRAYALLDEKYGKSAKESVNVDEIISKIEADDTIGVCNSLFNKFESVIIPTNPNINKIKSILTKNGAYGALMSGSGPSVFGIFENEDLAKKAYNALFNDKIKAFMCKTI